MGIKGDKALFAAHVRNLTAGGIVLACVDYGLIPWVRASFHSTELGAGLINTGRNTILVLWHWAVFFRRTNDLIHRKATRIDGLVSIAAALGGPITGCPALPRIHREANGKGIGAARLIRDDELSDVLVIIGLARIRAIEVPIGACIKPRPAIGIVRVRTIWTESVCTP